MCDGVMEKTIEHKGMMREREREINKCVCCTEGKGHAVTMQMI